MRMTGNAQLALRLAWLPTLRATPRTAPIAVGVFAIAMVGLTRLGRGPQLGHDPLSVRLALLLLGVMVVWCFEDPAGEYTQPTPVGRTCLRVLRAGTIVAIATVMFTLLLLLAGAGASSSRYLLEAATIVCWALAIAAVAARSSGEDSGRIGAGGLLVLFAATFLFPRGRALWGLATMEDRTAVVTWWALLAIGAAAAVIAISEPWADRRWLSRRSPDRARPRLPQL